MKKKLIIATRGSQLALWQAEHIASLVRTKHSTDVSLLILKTKGDIILDVPLAQIGGKGLFVKEIEEALLDGRADLAVHSMKDIPMILPEGLCLGIIPPRENPADMFLSIRFPHPAALPPEARVGTSSLRRQAQLLATYPLLKIEMVRGNIDTRLRKLEEGHYEALIMAAAGLRRLGLKTPQMHLFHPQHFLPAAGQGALGLEFCSEREDLHHLLAFLNHQDTYDCICAERAFLRTLEGGCQAPIAAFATLSQDTGQLHIDGLVANLDGSIIIRRSLSGPRYEAERLGYDLAEQVKAAGGGAILDTLYAGAST